MAVALLFTACGKGEFFSAQDSQTTRGGNGQMIGFSKVVQIAEDETRPAAEGEFSFELYDVKKGELMATLSTDVNGQVWIDFTEFSGKGSYFFREVFASEEEAEKWEPLEDLYFDVAPNAGAQWGEEAFAFNEGPVVVNIPVPVGEPVLGPVWESVTLTNDATEALSVFNPNSEKDHPVFCYAVLDRAALVAGETIKLDMVVEEAHTDIGDAFVTLEGGNIVITFDGVAGDGVHFEIYQGEWNNNANTHTGMTIACPEGEGDIAIYVHFDARFWIYE